MLKNAFYLVKSLFLSFIIVICLSILCGSNFINKSYDIEKVFSEYDIEFDSSNLNAWAKIGNNYIDIEGLEKEVLGILNIVESDTGLDFNTKDLYSNEHCDVRQVIYRGDDKEGNYYTIIMDNQEEKQGYMTYMVINIQSVRIKTQKFDSMIKRCFKRYSKSPNIFHTYCGYIDGEVSSSKQNAVVEGILYENKARKINKTSDGQYISLTGYSKSLDDYIETPNGRVNINVASRYSRYHNKTFFWFGTPLINLEY